MISRFDPKSGKSQTDGDGEELAAHLAAKMDAALDDAKRIGRALEKAVTELVNENVCLKAEAEKAKEKVGE